MEFSELDRRALRNHIPLIKVFEWRIERNMVFNYSQRLKRMTRIGRKLIEVNSMTSLIRERNRERLLGETRSDSQDVLYTKVLTQG